jgi:hypothetical protein
MLILYELLQGVLGAVGGFRMLKAGKPLATFQSLCVDGQTGL